MFDELKNNWKDQVAQDLPSVNTLMDSVKFEHSRLVMNLIATIIGIGIAIFAVVMVWYIFPFKYAMTQFAILAMVLIMVTAVVYMIYLRNKIPSAKEATHNAQDYVQLWIEYRENMANYSRNFMKIYFAVLTSGIAIYLYEVTAGNFWFRIGAYGSVVVWLMIVWFVLRPRWKKTIDEKVQTIIDNYTAIAEQFSNTK